MPAIPRRDAANLEAEFRRLLWPTLPDIRDHLPLLRSLAQGNVLEIGVDVGHSTTALLLGVEEKGGHLTSVDIRPECAQVFVEHPQWTFIDRSIDLIDRFPVCHFNLILIDGDHSYEGVRADLSDSLLLIADGGIILMHDVLAPAFPEVRRVFDEADSTRIEKKFLYEGSHGLGVIRITKG